MIKMKKNKFLILSLGLSAMTGGLCAAEYPRETTGTAAPQLIDWKPLMTVAPVKRGSAGQLLPLQSYDETIRRGMSFLLDEHFKWFKGPVDSITDENGKEQRPWVYYSNLQHNGAPFPNAVDRFVSYPAFHHALFIRTFLGYWKRTGDGRALQEAMTLADWNIAHSTPADWPYGAFPYSTFQEKKPGGFRDKSGLMPDKAAILALAYMDLHEATREARFLKAAQTIAEKLTARQRPDGTWPFRVEPKTEKVVEEYTSSVIYAVMLFERLDKTNGNGRFRAHRDLTWNWLVNGPIRTKEFRGFYEDIPSSTAGRTNYDCLDTIRYLLANRTADNGYLEKAKELNAWIEKTFMDRIKGFEPAEGIREQLQCNVVMGVHSLNWASVLLALAKATGDDAILQRALQTANYVTYYLQPDNRIVVGFQYNQWWYSCHAGVILYLFDVAQPVVASGEPPLRLQNRPVAADRKRMEIVCHRGANLLAPENTLAAARKAVELGADYVEVDVRTTSDGVMINIHDQTVNRTTDGTGRVNQLTAKQIAELDAGTWFNPAFKGERVPELRSFLESLRGKAGVYFDVKASDLEALIRLVYELRLEQKSFFWFGNPKDAERFRALDPKLLQNIGVTGVEDLRRVVSVFKPGIVQVNTGVATPEFISEANTLGVKVMIFYRGRDKAEFKRILESGAHMVGLDDLEGFLEVERELYSKPPAAAAHEPLLLENPHISVQIDRENGAIRSICDKEQSVVYPFSGIGFEVAAEGGTLRSDKALSATCREDDVMLRFAGNGLEVALHYTLGAEDRFVEKWLEIKSGDGKPYFLKSVMLEDTKTTAFSEIHFHDDQTIWHCPINLFLRGEKGGCFAGLAYPYWELKQNGKEGFRLGYQPNDQVAAKEVHVSEKYFLGVYRKEGLQRVSQGPYPGRGRNPYISFGHTGLSQQFKGGRVPAVVRDVPLEILDWGEVWAMQAFMQRNQPDDLQLPEDGYWIWQNGWWAGLFNPKPEILETLKAAGVHDIMTAHTWYGRGNHPMPEPYLSKMRVEPLGFPVDKAVAGMPGPAGPAAGWHAPQEVLLDQFKPDAYTTDFQAPPAMEAFVEAGRKLGVHVSSFALPGIWFDQKPEWGSLDPQGKPTVYLFGRKVSCPANDDYMKHLLAVHEAVFDKYKPRWWGWDGRWLSSWEVAGYRPGPLGCGLDPCYAKNHGHLPGDNYYREWKNIQSFLKAVRTRHPRLCLEAYYGLKRGEPWALRYMNSADNYYETSGSDMNRVQAWHNQNDRFRPVYKNYCSIFGETPQQFQHSVISTLSMSSYCQLGPGFKGLALAENREFLKKWRRWASENHAYLRVKRDLFACPGDSPVDGSAHIIKDRGFLFLFPMGGKKVRASIPVNRWLQLAEKPEAVYQLKEIYPREGVELGSWRYGEAFLYDMPQSGPVVLALEPAPAGSRPQQPTLAAPAEGTLVLQAFEAAKALRPDEPARLYRHYTFDTLLESNAVTPDASSQQVHARLSGQTLCEGVSGKALRFEAGKNGVPLGDLGLQASASLAFWLKTESPKADARLLSQLEGVGPQTGCLRLSEGNLQVWDAAEWLSVVSGLKDTNVWQHIAVVYHADGAVTGYLNGEKGLTAQSGFDFKGVKAGLGSRFLGQYGNPFAGALDDFRIYSGALTESEIKGLCANKQGK
jgi:glycerophosphoryl diester phosphodiesterase